MISLYYLAFIKRTMNFWKMHYWCAVIRGAFFFLFSFQIMTYFILTVVWNIVAKSCFSAQVNCVWFHTLPFPSISKAFMFCQWGFIHVIIRFLVQHEFSGFNKFFFPKSHPFFPLYWVFFDFWVTPSQFRLTFTFHLFYLLLQK